MSRFLHIHNNTEALRRQYAERFTEFESDFTNNTHEAYAITRSFFNVIQRLSADDIIAFRQNPAREHSAAVAVCAPEMYTILHRLNICRSEKDFRVFDMWCMLNSLKSTNDLITLESFSERFAQVCMTGELKCIPVPKHSRQIYEKWEKEINFILKNGS